MKAPTTYTEQEHALAQDALGLAFGQEYYLIDEDTPAVSRLLRIDFLDAHNEDGCSASEYARRIGKGNLIAYSEVMEVRERKGW